MSNRMPVFIAADMTKHSTRLAFSATICEKCILCELKSTTRATTYNKLLCLGCFYVINSYIFIGHLQDGGSIYSRAPVSIDSVPAVSVIRGSPQPEKKIGKLRK
jgi:hypothetical protein